MPALPRRAYEPGHRPSFLVVVDDTPECARAVRFAVRRAARTGAAVVMLAIAPPPESTEWIGVEDLMRAEAEEAAQARVALAASAARGLAAVEVETLVRTGEVAAEVLRALEEDEDVALLVLAAGSGAEGPGPLVALFAGKVAGTLPVPVAVVPGVLGDAEIDALA